MFDCPAVMMTVAGWLRLLCPRAVSEHKIAAVNRNFFMIFISGFDLSVGKVTQPLFQIHAILFRYPIHLYSDCIECFVGFMNGV